MLTTGIVAATTAAKWLMAGKIIKLATVGTKVAMTTAKYIKQRKEK